MSYNFNCRRSEYGRGRSTYQNLASTGRGNLRRASKFSVSNFNVPSSSSSASTPHYRGRGYRGRNYPGCSYAGFQRNGRLPFGRGASNDRAQSVPSHRTTTLTFPSRLERRRGTRSFNQPQVPRDYQDRSLRFSIYYAAVTYAAK